MNASAGAHGPARQAPIFGPEPWHDHDGITWSHWDRWACVVAVVDHGGDMAGLEADLVAALGSLDGRDDTEAKLSHVADLRVRLAAAGLTASELAGSDITADRTLVAKARSKLASRGIEGRAMTPAMRETPRVRLQRRARRGHWPAFPAPPERFYERFRAAVEVSGHITKNRSFAKTRTLGERLERLDGPRRRLPERLALYRAFHTAGLELADRADDSYGVIGELRDKAWRTYLTIDPTDAGMDPAAWWQDLCELIVWEPYGLGHEHETLPYRKLTVATSTPWRPSCCPWPTSTAPCTCTGKPTKPSNKSPGCTPPTAAGTATPTPPGASAATTGDPSSPSRRPRWPADAPTSHSTCFALPTRPASTATTSTGAAGS